MLLLNEVQDICTQTNTTARLVQQSNGRVFVYDCPEWTSKTTALLLFRRPNASLSVQPSLISLSGYILIIQDKIKARFVGTRVFTAVVATILLFCCITFLCHYTTITNNNETNNIVTALNNNTTTTHIKNTTTDVLLFESMFSKIISIIDNNNNRCNQMMTNIKKKLKMKNITQCKKPICDEKQEL